MQSIEKIDKEEIGSTDKRSDVVQSLKSLGEQGLRNAEDPAVGSGNGRAHVRIQMCRAKGAVGEQRSVPQETSAC
jgi:hypothetical protein